MYQHKHNYIYQFIPKDFQYLTQQQKIQFEGKNLKTSYLINIIHEFLVKYYFSNNTETKFNISSKILRKKYGEFYNYYIKYLMEKKFISLVSKYYVGKKTNTYKIDIQNVYDTIRHKNYDKILIKKLKRDIYEASITEISNSPIPLHIRKKLVENLQKITIDYDSSINFLDDLKSKKLIDISKYKKNEISVENIHINNIYFKFDSFGRFHTNFTILKKEIRNNHLSIDNGRLTELDIPNSQPLFFAILLKTEIPHINGDTKRYFELVKNGLIYDDITEKSRIKDRKGAKELMYKVLFGNNEDNKKENRIFKKLYPSVHEYILEYKLEKKNYRFLSHKLQNMESEFMFNDVVSEVMEKYPKLVFFTVHDSIIFPVKYKNEIKVIFDKHLNRLISKI
jgi:hypothetical protein